jgi:hypothetical protein
MVLTTISSLYGHLNLLYSADPNVRSSWVRAHRRRQARYLRRLARAESCRLKLASNSECERVHAAASAVLAAQSSGPPDLAFPEAPPPQTWLRLASDSDRLHDLCSTAVGKLWPVISAANQGEPCFCYGGVKPKASVDRRVREFAAGVCELDLWDFSRCRVVVEDVCAVFRTSEAILAAWQSGVVRYRDYYRSPRGGGQDPFRAVHMELRMGNPEAGEFVEVQVLTITRDAIGMLDHTIKRDRAVERCTVRHEEWLHGLSLAGNILDASLDK